MSVTEVDGSIIDGLYHVRDRLLVAITRMQAGDIDGASEELEAAGQKIHDLSKDLAA